MATSNDTVWQQTTNQVIQEALSLLGVQDLTGATSGEDYTSALVTLNNMLKHWEMKGIFVFTETEGTCFLNKGQQSYQLGNSSSDKIATGAVVETNLTVTAAGTSTVLTVTSTTGMNVNDTIGVVLDAGTISWTTISTIGSSTSVTLSSPIPTQASNGAYIYSYTNTVGRALEISSVRLRRTGGTDATNYTALNDFPMYPISRDTYFKLPNKGIPAPPIQYYVDRQINYTTLFVYPANDSCNNRLKFTYRREIQNQTNPLDTLDFMQEATGAIAWNLALWLAPKYGKEAKAGGQSTQGSTINARAAETLNDFLQWALEKNSLRIVPRIDHGLMK